MSAGIETYEFGRWIHDTLAAGTALCALIGGTASPRIYPDFIPQGTAGDSIIFSLNASNDDLVVTGTAAVVNAQFTIKAVCQDSAYSRGAAIMKQAHPLISAVRGTVYDGTTPALFVLQCVREAEIQYTEQYDGKRYAHIGGQYRVWGENAS